MGRWGHKKSLVKRAPAPYKSGFEYNVSRLLAATSTPFTYEPVELEYVLVKHYTPDFIINRPDGTDLYVESKGYFDHVSREKMVAVKTQHPDLEIVLLFMDDKLINKKSQFKYSDWAAKHGFDYSIGTVPYRWLYGSSLPNNLENKEIILDGNYASL